MKIRTLEAVHASLAALPGDVSALLCGDLNTPQYEDRDGTVQTFAQTRTGRLRPGRGERHDLAERSILTGRPAGAMRFARCTATTRATARGRPAAIRATGWTTSSSPPA